ncbi:MAG: U32 family peptidase [Lachnospiraceae bacterium]|nr:U32 family peptidase [Lachnospiraceae bacterium]
MNRVELLSPCGNIKSFYGAIKAGADAVYLGGDRFGARAYADNFTTDEIIQAVRYAHLLKKRVYLTLNTLIKEREFKDIKAFLSPLYEAGLDGVIIQDMGVLPYLRDSFEGFSLHASTQMTITSKYGAELLKSVGVCRIVPARELSLDEIKILKETGLEIEAFIHGAMCYAYSGQCLFSSALGGRSGNRGRCAGPCRLPYKKPDSRENMGEFYPLSLKDMSTLEYIPELIEAGIDSFKIEGRMKSPEYSAGVTAIYRKYIDRYYELKEKHDSDLDEIKGSFHIESNDLHALSHLYIRKERESGYYHRHNGREMVTLSAPNYNGNDEELINKIEEKYLKDISKLPIYMKVEFITGKEAFLELIYKSDTGTSSVSVTGDMVQKAASRPIDCENVLKQLLKLGETPFFAEKKDIEVNLSEDAFYPLKAINELRRAGINALLLEITEKNGFPFTREASFKTEYKEDVSALSIDNRKNSILSVSVRTKEQLDAISLLVAEGSADIGRIYINSDILWRLSEADIKDIFGKLKGEAESILSLPYIIRAADEGFLAKIKEILSYNLKAFTGILAHSVDGLHLATIYREMLKSADYELKIYADAGLYIWNNEALREYMSDRIKIDGFTYPYELNRYELSDIDANTAENEIVAYGRIPLMFSANCVEKTDKKCYNDKNVHLSSLTDRMNKGLDIEINCIHCMNVIYNSVPTSLHKELISQTVPRTDSIRLDFTVESGEEAKKIALYFGGLKNTPDKKALPPYKEYTASYFKHGVL